MSVLSTMPNSNPNINTTLNDDCLLLIFAQCSFQELFCQARLVCSRWNFLINFFINDPKHSLKLFGSQADIDEWANSLLTRYNLNKFGQYFKNDILVVGSNKFQLATRILPKLFANVRHLSIGYYYSLIDLSRTKLNSTFLLHNLLYGFAANLRVLTISRVAECAELQSKLWSQLDLLHSLRELHLFHLYEVKHIPTERLSRVLSHLERFSLTGYNGDLVPILVALNNGLVELRLDYVKFNCEDLRLVLERNGHFGRSLNSFFIGHNFHGHENRTAAVKALFQQICANFSAISNLDISYLVEPSFVSIVPELSLLSRLTQLRLEVCLSQLEFAHNELSSLCHHQTLDTIKCLRLCIFGYPTEHSFSLIPRLCPNLEDIQITFHYRVFPSEDIAWLKDGPFSVAKLPKLRRVRVDRFDQARHAVLSKLIHS